MKEFSIIDKLWNGIKDWNQKIIIWGESQFMALNIE
jgi:hypothetical protein